MLRRQLLQAAQGGQGLFDLFLAQLQFGLGQSHGNIGRGHALVRQVEILVAPFVGALLLRRARGGQVIEHGRRLAIDVFEHALFSFGPVAFRQLNQAQAEGLVGLADLALLMPALQVAPGMQGVDEQAQCVIQHGKFQRQHQQRHYDGGLHGPAANIDEHITGVLLRQQGGTDRDNQGNDDKRQ